MLARVSRASAESLSETAVTHRPQGVIIMGIYYLHVLKIFIIIIIIDNKIFYRLHTDSDFPLENVLNFHGRKNGGHFERRDAVNTFIVGEILPACAKEYLTAATYFKYCQDEVKVPDRTAAVDAVFPPVSWSDIISQQYGGRRVGLQMSNCDSFAKISYLDVCKPVIFFCLFV